MQVEQKCNSNVVSQAELACGGYSRVRLSPLFIEHSDDNSESGSGS